jgi:hypothetical protein
MKRHLQKLCLVVPEFGVAEGWPQGWDFPARQSWPPGWPRKYNGAVTLKMGHCGWVQRDERNPLWCRCLDNHVEETDEIVGQFLKISATCDGRPVRLRKGSEEPWSESGLFQVREFAFNKYGCMADLMFDVEACPSDVIKVDCALYGYSDGPADSIEVKVER